MDGTAWNPSWRWHERRAPLLRLTGEDGVCGIGEGWSDQAAIDAFFAAARPAAAALLGRDIDRPVPLPPLPAALPGSDAWAAPAVASAVDIALWDMHARRTGLPLHRLLGASGGRVPVYASGGLYGDGKTPAALAAEMAAYAAAGFTAVKMKVGALPLAEDLARVAAVRAAAGEVAILVDAVGQLTRATAPAWADALAELGVVAIQAPLPGHDIEGMAALQARGPLPVVAQEREYRPEAFAALLDQRAVGWLQFCPGLAGGITGGLALLARAEAACIPVTLQCYSTAVMQAACFQLGAGRPGVHSVEFHQVHDTFYRALPPGMTRPCQGSLHLGEEPGLGIDPGLPDAPPPGPGTIRRVFTLPH